MVESTIKAAFETPRGLIFSALGVILGALGLTFGPGGAPGGVFRSKMESKIKKSRMGSPILQFLSKKGGPGGPKGGPGRPKEGPWGSLGVPWDAFGEPRGKPWRRF